MRACSSLSPHLAPPDRHRLERTFILPFAAWMPQANKVESCRRPYFGREEENSNNDLVRLCLSSERMDLVVQRATTSLARKVWPSSVAAKEPMILKGAAYVAHSRDLYIIPVRYDLEGNDRETLRFGFIRPS